MTLPNGQLVDNKQSTNYLLSLPHVWGPVFRVCPVFPKWFIRKYKVDVSSGCWNWTGWVTPNLRYPAHKYGFTKYRDENGRRRSMAAHRYAYTLVHGAVPRNLDVDHLCNNKLCINPAHLEAVPHKVNCQRIPAHLRDRSNSAREMSRIKTEWWAQRRSK